MKRYIHKLADWPHLTYRQEAISGKVSAVARKQGRLLGRVGELGFELQNEATLRVLTEDIVQTSAIEGENLNATQVRSSVARRLGIDIGISAPADRHIDGIVEMMTNAIHLSGELLTRERLWQWHHWLFPTGYGPSGRINVGRWRSHPMHVLSGPIGRERVHFEAPAAERLDSEMEAFLDWFNTVGAEPEGERHTPDPIVRSAIAHLWFVTIHPFDDGNGRIARAIGDMLLARSDGSPYRFYSMSSQIRKERNAYYDMLEITQKGTLDITDWLDWYLACLDHALDGSTDLLESVLFKAAFWRRNASLFLSDRQRKVLNRLLDGFDGKLTAARWASMGHCSKPTAVREINDLLEKGVLIRGDSGGRSASYRLAGSPEAGEEG